MEHVLLNTVTPDSHRWTVRVRLVRFREYTSNDNPPKTLRMDMIALDEEGTTMEGQIPEKWVHLFQPQLKEDSVYYIKYFQVCNARNTYRPVDHPYMMRFTMHTKLYEVRSVLPTFPRYACRISSFQVLRNRIGVFDYCSDTIGVFKGATQVKLQNTARGTKPLRSVYITDGNETATVTLWNKDAYEFEAEAYMEMATHIPVVLLFVGITCRIYDEKLSLQGSTLCRWYANPEIPEAIALRDSCAGRIAPPQWYGPTASEAAPEQTTITTLSTFDNPHEIYGNRYTVNAKIKKIVPTEPWWYLACHKCNRTTKFEINKYKCNTPNCIGTTGGPRYCLPIIATDPQADPGPKEAPFVHLVFFGPIAQEIIGTPVDSLIASHGTQAAFLPTRLTSLYGKELQLRISVSPKSLQKPQIEYQVDAILGIPQPHTALPPITSSATAPQGHEEVQPVPVSQQESEQVSQESETVLPLALPDSTNEPRILQSTASPPLPQQQDQSVSEVTTTSWTETPSPQQAVNELQDLANLASTPPPQPTPEIPQQNTGKKRAAQDLHEDDQASPQRTKRRLNMNA